MKFGKLIFLFCLSINFQLFAQNWDWAIHGGGTTSDKGNAIVTDANGFSYVTGYFNEAADFGPFNMPLIDEHSKEVFIAKIDPLGNYVWVQRGSNHYDDRGLGICLDPMGNVYVTGTCWGGIIFGALNEYNSTAYTDQIFVLKLDNDGNFVWLRNAGNDSGDDHGQDVISDAAGNIYVTGFVSDYCFGNNGPSVAQFGSITVPVEFGDSLGFIAKISNDGVWQWAHTFGGIDGERDHRLAIDNASNVYIAGGFYGNKMFGSTNKISEGGVDIFVAKYDSNGNFIYVQTAGSELDDRANDVAVDINNDIYITGEFRDKVGFALDTINNNGGPNGRDIFVAKMAQNGTWKWATKAGSNFGDERGGGITTNNKNNIFVTGQFKGDANFGSSIALSSVSPDSVQIFVAAIDTLGKWKWAVQAGGQDDDERGNAISCDTSCNVYVTGYYRQNNTYGSFTVPNFGGRDIFIAKIDNACFEYTTDTIIDTVIVVNPPVPPVPIPYLDLKVYVPNAFTPNDDELNQTFKPSISTSVEPKNYSLKIYNRWGQLLFESLDYIIGWDGTFDTKMVKSEVYTWKLEFDIDEDHFEKTGHVLIFE